MEQMVLPLCATCYLVAWCSGPRHDGTKAFSRLWQGLVEQLGSMPSTFLPHPVRSTCVEAMSRMAMSGPSNGLTPSEQWSRSASEPAAWLPSTLASASKKRTRCPMVDRGLATNHSTNVHPRVAESGGGRHSTSPRPLPHTTKCRWRRCKTFLPLCHVLLLTERNGHRQNGRALGLYNLR